MGAIGANFFRYGNQPKHSARAGERRIAEKGCTQYLYDHSKVSVASMGRLAWQGGFTGFSLRRMVDENLISHPVLRVRRSGKNGAGFFKARMDWNCVSGDSGRNRSRAMFKTTSKGLR